MPSYKTHSIHGEMVSSMIHPKISMNWELFKLFCIGPDAMIATDYKAFDYQHSHQTRKFFLTMIRIIKKGHLQYDPEVMAFLYGQLDHFVLDVVLHPYIYYVTEHYPNKYRISFHGLFELWMDGYISNKYLKKNKKYYSRMIHKSPSLKKFINDVYQTVYDVSNGFHKYVVGFRVMRLFDSFVRNDSLHIFSCFMRLFSIGDITYHHDWKQMESFLNQDHTVWYDPESHQKHTDSFEDLWKESLKVSRELIDQVNGYLYYNQKLDHPFLQDVSYNTGLSCKRKQTIRYAKQYKGV